MTGCVLRAAQGLAPGGWWMVVWQIVDGEDQAVDGRMANI
jgi:hypothetical protein